MKLLTLVILALPCVAQITATLTGPASAAPGATINLTIGTAGNTQLGPVGVQWLLALPSGYTITSVTPGAQAITAQKQVQCQSGNLNCMAIGGAPMNRFLIAPGELAKLALAIPANATAGPRTVTFTRLAAADLSTAAAMPISSGPVYSVNVVIPSAGPTDIDGNGVVDINDVSAMIAQFKSGTCANDPRVDGTCDMFDVLAVILKALGF